jgi:hypothetical protein
MMLIEVKTKQPQKMQIMINSDMSGVKKSPSIIKMIAVMRWPHPLECDFDPAICKSMLLGWVMKGSRSPLLIIFERFLIPPKQTCINPQLPVPIAIRMSISLKFQPATSLNLRKKIHQIAKKIRLFAIINHDSMTKAPLLLIEALILVLNK